MTNLDALRRAICAAPEDDIVRGAFADALDEEAGGYSERAEFIRVQIELARDPSRKSCTCAACDEGNGVVCFTKQRERELFCSGVGVWEHFRDSFPGFLAFIPSQCQPGSYTGDQHVCVRRGFVSEVHAPLSVLIGRECERCGGNGKIWAAWEVKHESAIYPGRKRVNCPACSGTGRTVGVLPGIVQREPVVNVVATDREPMTYRLMGDPGTSLVPVFLFDGLPAWNTADAAKLWLSDRLLAWAKSETITI